MYYSAYMCVYIYIYMCVCKIFCVELMYAHIAHICREKSKDYVYIKESGEERLYLYSYVFYRVCMCTYLQVVQHYLYISLCISP